MTDQTNQRTYSNPDIGAVRDLVKRLNSAADTKDSNARFNHGWGNMDGSLLREAATALVALTEQPKEENA